MGKIEKTGSINFNLMSAVRYVFLLLIEKSRFLMEPAFSEILFLSLKFFYYRSKSFRKILPVLEEISICTGFSSGRWK